MVGLNLSKRDSDHSLNDHGSWYTRGGGGRVGEYPTPVTNNVEKCHINVFSFFLGGGALLGMTDAFEVKLSNCKFKCHSR